MLNKNDKTRYLRCSISISRYYQNKGSISNHSYAVLFTKPKKILCGSALNKIDIFLI